MASEPEGSRSARSGLVVAKEFLAQYGMMVEACSVGAYNEHPSFKGNRSCHIRDPGTGNDFANDRTLLVIASSKETWGPFLQWLHDEDVDVSEEPHPFDAFTKNVLLWLEEHLTNAGVSTLTWALDSQTRPFVVIMQAAAHLAGLAYYDQELMWACHPTKGLWIGLRGVFVLDEPCPAPKASPPAIPTKERQQIVRLRKEMDPGASPCQINLMQQRDAVSVAPAQKYSSEMIRFFHGGSTLSRKAVLRECLRDRFNAGEAK